MMMVFVALSLTFVDGGFGEALIQKRQTSTDDYSTVFIINIVLSIILYFLLFLFSNNISVFYNQPQITNLLKILGIILIIDSLGIVQNSILVKNIHFKKIAIIKSISAFIACSVAIVCAFKGLGVWSLVIQYVLNSIIKVFLLWQSTHWRPSLCFNKDSFRVLFGFGSKLLLARFISELYINFQSLIIGRVFNSATLGYFVQAKQLQQIPVSSLATIVNSVSLPIYSTLQEEKERLRAGARKSLKSIAFINFPLMVLLTVIAKPLIIMLYTEKWLPSVPYFQVLCVGFGMLLIVHSVNLSVLKSVGKTNWVLYLEVLKKVFGLMLIFLGIKYYGIMGMLIALSINSYLELFLNGYYTGKAIGYGAISQIRDLAPTFIVSIMAGVLSYALATWIDAASNFICILLSTSIFVAVFLSATTFLRFEAAHIYFSIIKGAFKK